MKVVVTMLLALGAAASVHAESYYASSLQLDYSHTGSFRNVIGYTADYNASTGGFNPSASAQWTITGPDQRGFITQSWPNARNEVGTASVSPDRLSTTLYMREAHGYGNIRSDWSSYFNLAPHTSITLSGMASVLAQGADGQPLSTPQIQERFSDDQWIGGDRQNAFTLSLIAGNQGQSTTQDAYALASLSALFDTRYMSAVSPANIADLVSYSSDATTGLLSLTVTNPFDHQLGGTFAARSGAYASLAPVPEPEMYLCLLVGLGMVGAAARKKQQGSRENVDATQPA